MTELGQFASTLVTVLQYLSDPLDQPLILKSERHTGSIHLITCYLDIDKGMRINFMFDNSVDNAISTAAMDQINRGKSLNVLESHLQSVQTANKYTATYMVSRGLQYLTGTCLNRKYVKYCDLTYDMYISIGPTQGWGWNEAELRRQSQKHIDRTKSCSYERYCPAN